jgi:hypothetical protein
MLATLFGLRRFPGGYGELLFFLFNFRLFLCWNIAATVGNQRWLRGCRFLNYVL